ncbi:MAG: helix-turn-helix domain-containing protein [Candidatus Thiodiazotropha sp.]
MPRTCCLPSAEQRTPHQEVACSECGLDPICQVLDYAEPGSGIPEGILIRRMPIPRGEMLLAYNQPFRAIYAVKSGSFKAMTWDLSSSERVVGFFLPGDLIGTDGLATDCYSYSVRALETSSVCRLEIEALPKSGRSREAIQDALITLLGQEVAMNHMVTTSLIQQNAEQRIAAFILSLARRSGIRGLNRQELGLSMSRSDIASYLGLARETVSRILTRFHNSNLIELRKHLLRVLDHGALERLSVLSE